MNKTLTTHRQRNRKEYNNALKKRTSLDFWLSKEVIEGWKKVERKGKRGHPFLYHVFGNNESTLSSPPQANGRFSSVIVLPFFSSFNCPFLSHPLPKDETIREMREKGFREWAKEKGYGRRNEVERTFSRMKGIFGNRVRARRWEGKESEIVVRIWILNRMLEMGMR